MHRDRRGIQVLERPDNRIVKLFYRRGGLSSDLLKPYAARFVRNSATLNRLGIESTRVEELYHCRSPRLDLVVYPKIPGKPIRELKEDVFRQAMKALPRFVADLHRRGVYFKGLHPGNVLYLPPKGFSLIDVVNVHFSRKPLSMANRARNLGHMLTRPEDAVALCRHGFGTILETYFMAAALDPACRSRLLRKLHRRASDNRALAAVCLQLWNRPE